MPYALVDIAVSPKVIVKISKATRGILRCFMQFPSREYGVGRSVLGEPAQVRVRCYHSTEVCNKSEQQILEARLTVSIERPKLQLPRNVVEFFDFKELVLRCLFLVSGWRGPNSL